MSSHCGSDNDVNDYERGWAEGRSVAERTLKETVALLETDHAKQIIAREEELDVVREERDRYKAALERIACGDVAASYEYDATPTEREIAQQALRS
jgi:hypothetical protein